MLRLLGHTRVFRFAVRQFSCSNLSFREKGQARSETKCLELVLWIFQKCRCFDGFGISIRQQQGLQTSTFGAMVSTGLKARAASWPLHEIAAKHKPDQG